jgi:hypothetical protein
MLHSMAVPNSMWSCAVNTVVYLRNHTYNRPIGLTSGIPLTLLTSSAHDASKFRVFGCVVFAKVPDKFRRKLGEKAFRGVMVDYPTDAPGYRAYNPETRRITTSVHVVFQEHTPGFATRIPIDSVITYPSDDEFPMDTSPPSHPIDTPLPDPQPLLQPHVMLDSGRTPSATGTLWPTCLNTRHSPEGSKTPEHP